MRWIGGLVVLCVVAGCGGDDSGGSGSGGMAAAGATGGAAGVAGTGVAGTGVAGTGVAGTGVAGMATAGMGATGVPGCEVATAGDPAALHMAALMQLNTASPCGFSPCHDSSRPPAMVQLLDATDLATTLVDKPSCENPSYVLVKSGGTQAALDGSWLWQKLTAPAEADGSLIAKAEWGTAVTTCGQLSPGTAPFGTRMPQVGNDDLPTDGLVTAVRNWICAGAPGP